MMMSIDREEATIKFSFPYRKSVEKTSDEELLVIISEGITCLLSCHRTSCDCLGILSDVNVREYGAQYLLQFVKKSKYDQDSIILEWYKYAISARIASMIGDSQPLRFCLPYDATLIPTWIVFVHPKSINYAYLGCVHFWVSETSNIDPSEPPLPLVSCQDIREQEKRAM